MCVCHNNQTTDGVYLHLQDVDFVGNMKSMLADHVRSHVNFTVSKTVETTIRHVRSPQPIHCMCAPGVFVLVV